ncbi:MAG: ABC transporter ATP-binding protein [Hyphomicrobiaceae bacterium]
MTSPLVVVDKLHREFDVSKPWLNRVLEGEPKQSLKAVTDVSFAIERGKTFGLVGESGCGKSTVARLVVGLTEPTSGSVSFENVRVGASGWPAHRRRVQMVFQDPYASLNPRWRVAWIVAEPIQTFNLAATREATIARVSELLTLVGLDPRDAEKYPHEFSGGQRQRIAIARALACEPDFIVCDEPTSALDVSVQAQVLNLMRELQAKLGLTYLLISHDLAVVRHMSDSIGVMYLGRLVEIAEKKQIFEAPQHPYTQMLLASVPDIDALDGRAVAETDATLSAEIPSPIDPPPGCAFHPRCPKRFAPCDQERPKLVQVGTSSVACHAVNASSNAAPETARAIGEQTGAVSGR